jgi:hypothetical protein
MSEYVINNIPFELEMDRLLKMFHVTEGSSSARELKDISCEALAVANPKAIYKAAFIETRGDDYVVIDGKPFTSRVLRVNLEQAHRVFPYVVTCGTELEDWSRSFDEMLQSYWIDRIKEMALRSAIQAMNEELEERFHPGQTSKMSPGSLEDWPLTEQDKLFALFGSVQDSIGVQLTKSFLMTPIKSVSGIRFPTEVLFESCQLCSRENCPGRKAAYDKDLYERKYRLPQK